jgi:hypothetical protein
MSQYIVALDLGQEQDFSALCVVRQTMESDPDNTGGSASMYLIQHLQRWPLRTPYTEIVSDVAMLLAREPLPGCWLALDGTGVGKAVTDMFRTVKMPARLVPITIHGVVQVCVNGEGWSVPKKDLVGVLQVLLQRRRLKVARLPERETLLQEMRAFRVKVSATGHESFAAWRERDHDDLVLAVALACWLGESRHLFAPPRIEGPLVWNRPMPGQAEQQPEKREHEHVRILKDLGIWQRMMDDW